MEPVWWRNIRWIKVKVKIKNGKIKCNPKNRIKVGLFTENPPQIHWIKFIPIIGITLINFVITDVPQKDIWPHGRTYPKKAVPIVISNKETPTIQVSINLYDW